MNVVIIKKKKLSKLCVRLKDYRVTRHRRTLEGEWKDLLLYILLSIAKQLLKERDLKKQTVRKITKHRYSLDGFTRMEM